MPMTTIRFSSFPRTQPPPVFVEHIVSVFRTREQQLATKVLQQSLDSNGVLAILRAALVALGFQVEQSKTRAGKIERQVFYGENGERCARSEHEGPESHMETFSVLRAPPIAPPPAPGSPRTNRPPRTSTTSANTRQPYGARGSLLQYSPRWSSGNAACCTAAHGVICHPVAWTVACTCPVQQTAALHRSP